MTPLEVIDLVLFLLAIMWFKGASTMKDDLSYKWGKFFDYLHLAGIPLVHLIDYFK